MNEIALVFLVLVAFAFAAYRMTRKRRNTTVDRALELQRRLAKDVQFRDRTRRETE